MSGQPSMPAIENENLRDPVQFKVKYEMEPFRPEVRKTDLSAGLYIGIGAAIGTLLVDVHKYGASESLAAIPVHGAVNGYDYAKSQFEYELNPDLRSFSYGKPADENRQTVATALKPSDAGPPSAELRSGIYAGTTALFAFGAVALAVGLRYGKLFRKKHFKAKKPEVEALEAALADTKSGDRDRPD